MLMLLASEAAEAAHEMGETLGYWTVIPFVGMLLAIAILPLVTPVWFEHLKNKGIVAAIFGVPVLAYLAVTFGGDGIQEILMTGEEYISFIIYIAALFTIAGGIYISGDTLGSPKNNTIFLIVGALLANFVGTTGAAMLMIRPLLRANHNRTHKKHIFVFLIFIVCNTAGLLTPLGDPPLFLGFLRGIDFTWTLRLWPQWLLTQIILLVIFFVLDSYFFKKEPASAKTMEKANPEKIRIHGGINFLFLAGVIAATMISGTYGVDKGGPIEWWMRDAVYVLLVLCSLFLSPKEPRQRNRFSWAPIGEVAIVFAGIFASMIPALQILKARGDEFGVTEPWQFFWLSGGPLVVPRQRANVPRLHLAGAGLAGTRELPGLDEHDGQPGVRLRAGGVPRGRVVRRRVHGRQLVHRQRAQLHGEVDRGRARHSDAELLRLHSLGDHLPDPDLHPQHVHLLPLSRFGVGEPQMV